jgi:hypothetical protein
MRAQEKSSNERIEFAPSIARLANSSAVCSRLIRGVGRQVVFEAHNNRR